MNLCAEGGMDKMKIWHAPPPPAWEGGGGGEGNRTLKENLKLDNPNIESIFRITSLIYSRCIRGNHQYVLLNIPH